MGGEQPRGHVERSLRGGDQLQRVRLLHRERPAANRLRIPRRLQQQLWGRTIPVQRDAVRPKELFQPGQFPLCSSPQTDGQNITPPTSLRTVETGPAAHSLKDLVPLSQLVHDSIMACDVDVRASLLQNIVVVGNTSLTKGLTERLDLELAGLMPSVRITILN